MTKSPVRKATTNPSVGRKGAGPASPGRSALAKVSPLLPPARQTISATKKNSPYRKKRVLLAFGARRAVKETSLSTQVWWKIRLDTAQWGRTVEWA